LGVGRLKWTREYTVTYGTYDLGAMMIAPTREIVIRYEAACLTRTELVAEFFEFEYKILSSCDVS
jgi:hypothetical protein